LRARRAAATAAARLVAAFTTMLATFLAGLAVGSAVHALLLRGRRAFFLFAVLESVPCMPISGMRTKPAPSTPMASSCRWRPSCASAGWRGAQVREQDRRDGKADGPGRRARRAGGGGSTVLIA
jgi:hypothetical protein